MTTWIKRQDQYYTTMVYRGSDGSRVKLHPVWKSEGKDAKYWDYSFPPGRLKYDGGDSKIGALIKAANHKGLSGKAMNWEPFPPLPKESDE